MVKSTLKIEGMMCEGCENRIKNILKNIDNVNEVEANHQTKIVTITSEKEISKEKVRKLLEDLGFQLIEEG